MDGATSHRRVFQNDKTRRRRGEFVGLNGCGGDNIRRTMLMARPRLDGTCRMTAGKHRDPKIANKMMQLTGTTRSIRAGPDGDDVRRWRFGCLTAGKIADSDGLVMDA